MRKRWPLKIARVIVIVCAVAALLGFIVMQLWNWLVPDLFHGPVLGYGQAIGLLILSRILLFGGPPGRFGGGHDRWRERFRQRWEQMSPEEREKIRSSRHCDWMKEEGMVGSDPMSAEPGH